jgi:hypothetical protein
MKDLSAKPQGLFIFEQVLFIENKKSRTCKDNKDERKEQKKRRIAKHNTSEKVKPIYGALLYIY